MFSVLALSLLSLLQSNNPVELLFIGDAMQHMAQITAASRGDGTYDYSQCFALIEDEVRAADYAVVNLEVTLGGKTLHILELNAEFPWLHMGTLTREVLSTTTAAFVGLWNWDPRIIIRLNRAV